MTEAFAAESAETTTGADDIALPLPLRAAGETSASPQRAAQRMHGDALAFHLIQEIDELKHEPSWQRGDRNAKTLVQERDLHVLLVVLKSKARIAARESRTQVTAHVIEGRLLVHLSDRTIEVFADRLVAIAAGVAHELEALEESAFLLTIAGSPATSGRTEVSAHAVRAEQGWVDDGGRV